MAATAPLVPSSSVQGETNRYTNCLSIG
uniref:Uncharacterized protein n=1 Tax=Arundo donax TaxID=35708 RepID=A0A0A8YW63_ARUDO